MSNVLNNRIDFSVIIKVKDANPNGDPSANNRPRQMGNLGHITGVCLKRKIRNRWMMENESVFVQSDNNCTDFLPSLKARLESNEHGIGLFTQELKELEKKHKKDGTFPMRAKKMLTEMVCKKWIDTRAFGTTLAFKSSDIATSHGIKGPVTIQECYSIEPVEIVRTGITKSVSSESDGDKKGSDTMGERMVVREGVYVAHGSICVHQAQQTGFTEEDAEKLKNALSTLFYGDYSSARPAGSMVVKGVVWVKHPGKHPKLTMEKMQKSVLEALSKNGDLDTEFLQGIAGSYPGVKMDIIEGY